jgi:hypothetical protein
MVVHYGVLWFSIDVNYFGDMSSKLYTFKFIYTLIITLKGI